MKTKHLFWITCVVFLVLAVKFGLAGEPYMAMLVVACSIASAANAMRPGVGKPLSWVDMKKLFGIN